MPALSSPPSAGHMMVMASSSSSTDSCTYDVFLSFRGEDTRKSLVCHLYNALNQKAFKTHIDSEKLEKGHKISELMEAIKESTLSVVVLSQNYAASTWCLKELVKILECKDGDKKQVVLPVFYEVDLSDVRKIKGSFKEAFAEHEQNSKMDKEVLESWKSALTKVADVSCWDSREHKTDIELIEKIVSDREGKWIHNHPQPSSLASDLVAMDLHIKEVSLRFSHGVNDVGIVGIWGMPGIGKTTIARAVYDETKSRFEHKCFKHNVKKDFTKEGEAKMRGEILSLLLNENVQSVGIYNEGSNVILERLGKKKVLIVHGGVETVFQIDALLGSFHSFGVGSRILVTTRAKESLAGVYETYQP